MRFRSLALFVVEVTALAAALTLLGILSRLLQPTGEVSLVYPATGLGAALLWGFGMRWWPAFVLSQIAISYLASKSPWVAMYVAAMELLVVVLFCFVMTRLRVARNLTRLRDVAIFILGALATTCASGIAAIIGEYLLEKTPRNLVADGFSFWFSDFVSILIFVPLVLGWRRWPFASRAAFGKWLALTLLLVLLGGAIAIGGERASATLFLLLPIVVFTAVAAGIPGAATSSTVLLLIFISMHLGHKPDHIEAIIRVVFVGTTAATGYVLAVVWGERELNARRLFHLAHHDPLTGMDNRHELERRLGVAVAHGEPSAHALLYLDLDQFKLVNDTCGHVAGDRMLQEVSAELQTIAPDGVRFARLGGDEFACILENATKEEAVSLANAIHTAMARYRFGFGSMSFAASMSIGITLFPAEEGDTADAVLGRADVACYVAKEDGRHRSHIYMPRDEAMLRWHSSLHQVSQLEMAMENGGLQLWRQSIVDLSDRPAPDFCEVLLRLSDNGDVRTSAEFLPVAQRFGFMDRIDRWVLENACRFLAEHDDDARLSVNVSGSTLSDPAFYETVIALPDRFGFDPRRLCLEVTEGVMIHRLRQATDAMKALRARGFDLALDDFGAGVASFAYLQELPVTYVKIDGRIVQQLRTDPASEVIVGSLVRLARLRNIECIAEWVECDETLERLRTLGVRYAQGFFLHEPSPLHERIAGAA